MPRAFANLRTVLNLGFRVFESAFETIQAYLDACIEESIGDPDFIVYARGVIAQARNMSQLSRDTGISREGLDKAFSEQGNPTFSTIAKVASALGLTLTLQPKSTNS